MKFEQRQKRNLFFSSLNWWWHFQRVPRNGKFDKTKNESRTLCLIKTLYFAAFCLLFHGFQLVLVQKQFSADSSTFCCSFKRKTDKLLIFVLIFKRFAYTARNDKKENYFLTKEKKKKTDRKKCLIYFERKLISLIQKLVEFLFHRVSEDAFVIKKKNDINECLVFILIFSFSFKYP